MYTTPAYLLWLIATLVVLLLLWLAWRRPNRQRLALRLLASTVAGISLVLLVFPPTVKQAINPGEAILLTDGYNPDTLNSLLAKQQAKPVVYSLNAESDKAIRLTDLYALRQQQPNLQKVHLLGYGLDAQQLQTLKEIELVPHLMDAPDGINAVQWPEEVKLGEAVTVAGKYKTRKPTKLYLHAAGQLRDSVAVKPGGNYTFSLRYTPKQAGRDVYTLVTKTDNQTDTLGQIPMQIKEQQPLQILLLAAAPSFEFKFLKNYLAGQQHKIAFRTTVSRDISQSEWVNLDKTNLSRITPKLLQNFDVVITEPEALQSISAGERATLQRAVSENGLGVLTVATEPTIKSGTSFFTGFQGKRLSQQENRSVRARWANREASINASPYTLTEATTVTGLISDQGNNLLAGVKRAGWGKVAMSFVPQTFPWLLEGKEELYASYWSTILSGIAKEEVKDTFWQLAEPQAPQPNKPVILSFTDYTLGDNAPIPAATMTSLSDTVSINLPLAQNIHQPEKYNGTFWPRTSGWHKVETTGTTPYFFYVQNPSDWKFESIATRRAATEEFIAQQSIKATQSTVAFKEEPVSLIWFFILFVLSSGFLWLEEKL